MNKDEMRKMWEAAGNSRNPQIVKTGTSINAAGEKIAWTHTHNKGTGTSSIKDNSILQNGDKPRDATVVPLKSKIKRFTKPE